MANARSQKKIVHDGWRNAVVELAYSLDTPGSFADAGVITLADFTNNMGAPSGAFNGLRLAGVRYSITVPVGVQVFWNATADQPMIFLAGSEHTIFKTTQGLIPDRAAAGYDGAIDINVVNIPADATAAQLYIATLYFEFIKLYAAP